MTKPVGSVDPLISPLAAMDVVVDNNDDDDEDG
jgi:hypothetical protein